MLLPKRLEISSIDLNKPKTISKRVIQANIVDFYYTKLCKSLRTSFFIKDINTCHFSDIIVDTKIYMR